MSGKTPTPPAGRVAAQRRIETSTATTSASDARAAAERAARASYGRLVALLAAPTRDVPAAEDALSVAFERALLTWSDTGVPDNPEGWLLTVARNHQRDVLGSAARRTSAPIEDAESAIGGLDVSVLLERGDAIPDKRLELLFACAHPAGRRNQ